MPLWKLKTHSQMKAICKTFHKSNTLILDQTKDITAINKTKYKEGNGEFLNYLSSKIALVQSQRQNLQLKYNKLKNRINLYLALGYSFI